MVELTPVQRQIADLLQAGRTLAVRWDCGGDESFVYTEVDGQEIRANYENDHDLAFLLDCYLTELLELPDAGDFQMKGTGRIFREGPEVIIECQSEFIDDGSGLLTDEEWRELSIDIAEWRAEATATSAEDAAPSTDYQPDPTYSGRRVLFALT